MVIKKILSLLCFFSAIYIFVDKSHNYNNAIGVANLLTKPREILIAIFLGMILMVT